MNAVKMGAIVLIKAGILGLTYAGCRHSKELHKVKLGPIELSVKDRRTANIPVWVGVGAIIIGGALLVASYNRKNKQQQEKEKVQ
jgi:hypothetical protein